MKVKLLRGIAMKQFTLIWRKLRKNIMIAGGALLLPSSAFAAGLARAKGALETVKGELLTIIPVVAVIALMLLAVGYATRSVEKETFWRWAVGVIVAGSAAEITAMLFS